ncbi:MAG: Minf_1886 family protein [Planctomycetota bacterium]|jgi:uncharacterized repeat protein (TIGR04138 family)
MTQQQEAVDWKRILAEVPYPIEAFVFVREGLSYAVQRVHEDPEALEEEDRHITGQQLCLGLRELAIEKYGLLAPVVLEHWRVRRTFDFGRIVFAMIEAGLMTKTHRDSLEDFQAVYDFDEAFSREALLAHIGRN